MAPNEEDDFPAIGYKCVEMCNTLVNQGSAFKFSLIFGSFSFQMDNAGIRSSPAQLPKKKRKSPGAIQRDKKRRIAFLKRKAATSSPSAPQSAPDTSSYVASGSGNPSHVVTEGAADAQGNTLDQLASAPDISSYVTSSGSGDPSHVDTQGAAVARGDNLEQRASASNVAHDEIRHLSTDFRHMAAEMERIDQESLDCRIAAAAARRRPARAGKRIKYLGIPPGFQID